MTFGQRLRELRQHHRMTQRDLAALAGADYTYISKLETGIANGLPSERLVTRLATVLGADAAELNLLAGRIPEDVLAYLRGNPGAIAVIRAMMREED